MWQSLQKPVLLNENPGSPGCGKKPPIRLVFPDFVTNTGALLHQLQINNIDWQINKLGHRIDRNPESYLLVTWFYLFAAEPKQALFSHIHNSHRQINNSCDQINKTSQHINNSDHKVILSVQLVQCHLKDNNIRAIRNLSLSASIAVPPLQRCPNISQLQRTTAADTRKVLFSWGVWSCSLQR